MRLKLRIYLEKNNPGTFLEAVDILRNYDKPIKNQSSDILCDAVMSLYKAPTVFAFMKCIIANFHGFEQDYTKADKDNHYKNPQFIRLGEISKKYGDDLRKFYRDIEKARKNGELSRKRLAYESSNDYADEKSIIINLITATRSKGKEYDAVILLDCDEDEWPAQLSNDIEEERRLFYVAMTRARKYLYFVMLTNTCSRFLLEAGIV